MEKLLEAIAIDLDAITFWASEQGLQPATATIIQEEKECRWCATEYRLQYCPTCGMDNE